MSLRKTEKNLEILVTSSTCLCWRDPLKVLDRNFYVRENAVLELWVLLIYNLLSQKTVFIVFRAEGILHRDATNVEF